MSLSHRTIRISLIFLSGFLFLSENLAQNISFNHLTVENGLSNNKVNTVIQDRTGFIWFGTEDGLDRYDGYNFKVFRHDANDTNSISGNCIWSLLEDHSGYIWVGTKAGVVNRYDPLSGKFTHWKIESKLTEENSINKIYEDSKENIWIGTYKEGLYRLNPVTSNIDHWAANPDNEKSLSHNYIQGIIEDNDGNLIIGTYNGLNKFKPKSPQNGFEHFYFSKENANSLSNNLIWSLSKSDFYPNIIWICTFNNLTKFDSQNSFFERIKIDNPDNLQYGTSVNSVVEEIVAGENILWTASYSGLLRINLARGNTTRFVHDEDNSQSLISDQINKIIKDRTGVLWIVTENGISYITPKSALFNSQVFGNAEFNTESTLKKKNITAIAKSGDDRIWIGTTNSLYLLDDIETNPKLRNVPEFDRYHIWSLVSTNKNEIWIGTYGKGLKQYNYSEKRLTNWNLSDPKIRTQSVYYNKTLLVDSKENIWVGYWGFGVARINPASGKYNVWLNEPGNSKSVSHNDVWVIKEDRFGRIWIGTQGGGLNLFEDREGGIFHHWSQTGSNKNILSSNNINSIYEAKKLDDSINPETILWIGTNEGLDRFEVINNNGITDLYNIDVKNQFYSVKDGLPDNSVNSILEDENGNLWLGTGSGISFFDVSKKSFTNFTTGDGLSGTVMNPESALILNNGLMLFGSAKGLNIFDPKNIKLSSYKPRVVITDFQLFNKSVKIGNNSPLRESIYSTDEITLSNDQDVFSFEFAALDYNSSRLIQYAYKMEGFDEGWINSGTRRFVTYTNLDPGKYIFKVKSTNADGVWSDKITSIRIIMNPPLWKTFWAFGLYIILIFLGLLGIRRFELNRAKLRNELKLREFEVKKKSELEEIKSRFFANLSHEFRTPLMLIKGPLEQLKAERNGEDYYKSIDMIERNSNKLKELIDQLLELSQLEKASIPLKAKQENIIIILKGIISFFEPLTKQKNIFLNFENESDQIVCWIDRDKFEKIVNNLLSNAVKFTPDGGKIIVAIKQVLHKEKQFAEIKIADSGVGIPKDNLEKIFDRFYQVDDSTSRSYGGSGVGLALVKEFVEFHKWKISVESEPGKETEFILQIPMWDNYLDAEGEAVPENILGIAENNKTEKTRSVQSLSLDKEQIEFSNKESKPSILITDDSDDVRKYLSGLLKNNYTIYEASNGGEGIKAAAEKTPDLIISDIMMPSIDGIEFCRRIKSDWQTSDIPVILLTAKASSESKIEGLEIGADDYLTKPFDSRELFTRIKNLLEQRMRLREKYSKDLNVLTGANRLSKTDDDFIKKALELIEKNLDKTNFGTEELARQLYVSRTQLHRKILSITEQAPGEFIRLIKLKHAAKLLIKGELSITQIAYEIGFSSPAQFTRAFTKQFNCLPSEFSSRNKS